MSTTYTAELHAGIKLSYILVSDAIIAIDDEASQEAAWDAVNDVSLQEGALDDPDPELYVGMMVMMNDQELTQAELMARIGTGLETYRAETLSQIEDHFQDSQDPQFTAFMDWFFKQVAEAPVWKYRILMYWG